MQREPRQGLSDAIYMDNRSSWQSSISAPVQGVWKGINRLPDEILIDIMRYVAIEPNETTRDQTVQKKRNLCPVCLVSNKFRDVAMDILYMVITISDLKSLRRFHEIVNFQPATGRFVRKLFVNLGLCWGGMTVEQRLEVCDQLYRVLETTTSLRLLSLDLRECTDCFRNIGPADFAFNWANDGYDNFYEQVRDRIRDELNVESHFRTFLPKVEEFHFSSNDIPYAYCAFFALQSLKRIVSMTDTGAWPMILDPSFDVGIDNPHIKALSLKSSAILPLDVEIIRQSFPDLEEFRARTDPQEANGQYHHNGLTHVQLTTQNLSAALARWPNLQSLELGLDYPMIKGRRGRVSQINFPLYLGPEGGINSLGGLQNLADLHIGMHLLMCYRGQRSQPQAQPLSPSVLPPALERLRLYTCLKHWSNRIAGLSRSPWQQTEPSCAGESTLSFIKSLATHVTHYNGLRRLRDVRLYSQEAWWLAYGVDYRTVRHCKEEQGQKWNAGGLEERCKISRFENRTPGIHFRAYKTDEFECGQARPCDDS